jgi:NAD(P)-dependent dehydrogenase (short-subunit alcohol dehydrogenase family)
MSTDYCRRLAGKSALVTGGTSGIGLATVRRFLAEGARVIATGSSDRSIGDARQLLSSEVTFARVDAGDLGGQGALADAVRAEFGHLDIAFLNAGITDFRPIGGWDAAGVDRSLRVDLEGPMMLVQALLPILSNPASIILSGSINAHLGMAGTHVYSMAKAGAISLARTLSGELVGRGVRVNVISPGPIDTPLNGKLGLPPEEMRQRAEAIVKMVPAGRFGRPEEVAAAAAFLAADESAFMVGAELIMDGGLSIR